MKCCDSQTFELPIDASARLLIVNYDLPAPSALPASKEVKYNAAKDEIVSSGGTGALCNAC